MVWPLSGLLAHCQSFGAALMGSGVLAGVDLQGAQGQEGQAQLSFPSEIRLGGALRHQEGVRPPAGGMDPQKHGIGYLRDASKFHDGNSFPLGFWLGMGEGDGTGERLCSPPN